MMKTKKIRRAKRNTKAMWDMFDKAETSETKLNVYMTVNQEMNHHFVMNVNQYLELGKMVITVAPIINVESFIKINWIWGQNGGIMVQMIHILVIRQDVACLSTRCW